MGRKVPEWSKWEGDIGLPSQRPAAGKDNPKIPGSKISCAEAEFRADALLSVIHLKMFDEDIVDEILKIMAAGSMEPETLPPEFPDQIVYVGQIIASIFTAGLAFNRKSQQRAFLTDWSESDMA